MMILEIQASQYLKPIYKQLSKDLDIINGPF